MRFERHLHDAFGVLVEGFTRLGEGQADACAGEEADPVVLLQRVDLHGHGGLGDEQFLRGLGEAQVLGDVVEDLELLEVEIEVHEACLAGAQLFDSCAYYRGIPSSQAE